MNSEKSNATGTLTAYLAGAIEYAPDNGCAWREEITRFLNTELGHQVFNPCLEENHVLTPEEFRHFREWKRSDLPRFRQTVRKIIHTDLTTLLNRIDYIICLWDEYVLHGAGTHGELTLAFWHNIPVYVVSYIPVERMSSWIIGCSTELFTDFNQLQEFLRQRFKKGNPAGSAGSDMV